MTLPARKLGPSNVLEFWSVRVLPLGQKQGEKQGKEVGREAGRLAHIFLPYAHF